jgi:hypothetical protein
MIDLLFALASLFLLSFPLALVGLFVLSAPVGAAMAYFVTEGPNGMAAFFQPDRGLNLGWPIGVQEEDAPGWQWRRAVRGDDVIPQAASLGTPADLWSPAPGSRTAATNPYGVAPTRVGHFQVRFASRRPS